MSTICKDDNLYIEERKSIHELLANNPNYFGTVANVDFSVQQPVQYNTTYEELTCVGLWPERNLLQATLVVKLPFGFLGEMCSRGSFEYVRFFIDWNDDGDFSDANEDLGVARVNVHDIPEVGEHKLCYAVRLPFKPFLANCKKPYIVKLRAILSWEIVPPPGDWNFTPIWGNRLDCWVQIDPVNGQIIKVFTDNPEVEQNQDEDESKSSNVKKPKKQEVEPERAQFLELLKKNPNHFGTLPISDIDPIYPLKCNTRYEELNCIGLYPEDNFLEAILQVKLPYGFLGDLCSAGSHEYVRFYIDWNGDGDFIDLNEDAGVSAVKVHDIPEVSKFHLCYSLGQNFQALRANCQRPRIVKVRAILSWQQVPTGPNFIPIWGNILECWVQIHPTEQQPPHLVADITQPTTVVPPVCINIGPIISCTIAGVTISGSAGGGGFASYRIEYRAMGSATWIQTDVIYPDCTPASTTPDHTTPRFTEPLAYLTNLEPDEYEVSLIVNGTGGPLSDTATFALHRSPVVIDAIGDVDVRDIGTHPADPTELLKVVQDVASGPETSIGGRISVEGSADFYGCGQQMIEYVLQMQDATCGLGGSPQGTPPNPPPGPPSCAAPPQQDDLGPWADIKPPLPFGDTNHPRWYWCLPVNRPNFVLNGSLNRIWATRNCRLSLFPPVFHTVRRTEKSACDTRPINGRYTVRLRVRHQDMAAIGPIGEIYDAATVWLDNRNIDVRLTGLGVTGGINLDDCEELRLSQFVGTTMDVKGRAWDPLILDSEPAWLVPNDNFDYYKVQFAKDSGGYINIVQHSERVPNTLPALPAAPADVGVLVAWDIIGALDAGPAPSPYVAPPYPKLYRGERCAYMIRLYARDKTLINDRADVHDAEDYWPFCIVNDLE